EESGHVPRTDATAAPLDTDSPCGHLDLEREESHGVEHGDDFALAVRSQSAVSASAGAAHSFIGKIWHDPIHLSECLRQSTCPGTRRGVISSHSSSCCSMNNPSSSVSDFTMLARVPFAIKALTVTIVGCGLF